jgi:hypothetical protein
MQTITQKPKKSISHLGLLHMRTSDLVPMASSDDLLPPITTDDLRLAPEHQATLPLPRVTSQSDVFGKLKSGPMPAVSTNDLVEAIFNDVVSNTSPSNTPAPAPVALKPRKASAPRLPTASEIKTPPIKMREPDPFQATPPPRFPPPLEKKPDPRSVEDILADYVNDKD